MPVVKAPLSHKCSQVRNTSIPNVLFRCCATGNKVRAADSLEFSTLTSGWKTRSEDRPPNLSVFQKSLSPPGPLAEETPAELQQASPPLGNECSKPSKKNLSVLPSSLLHGCYKLCVPAPCAPTLGGSVLPNVERGISKPIAQPLFLTDFAGGSW